MMNGGKIVLITGGTGSLGRVIVSRLLKGEKPPKKIIVFSRDEAKQHEMRLHYLNTVAATDEVIYSNFKQLVEFRIGDVRNYADVCSALKDVDIVINAAALKQVPVCEYFPMQAILTNCMGANNIVRAISENDLPVEVVVGVSTDKATKPVNAMGMSKALQERIFISANILNPKTRFVCVRYGNVLASRGSVIPLFHYQIKNGGPVTLTDPEMTRFLLSLDQAVDTVFAAIESALPGEIYVPDVPSVKIENVAKALIGDRRIDLQYIGIRPGEKMHEILISEEEIHHTIKRGDFYVIRPMLPELRGEEEPFTGVLDKEFSSADNLLDYEGTVELLRRNRLMIEDIDFSQGSEILR
ncbi:MAG: polysaccharide biosynthesis protein [Actinobacteria bacterium]|nr:polysaccharide biosynthesis protein [Actinomycetota bacterium]